MAIDTTIKSGYKQTELGIIPKDWIITSLAQNSAFITKGSTPTTYGFQWESSGTTFLRSECVSEHGLDLEQSMFISKEANLFFRRSEVSDGDILVTITGNVGRVIHLFGIGLANINQHIARVRIKSPNIEPSFVYYILSQPSSRRYFNSITTGQAYPQISLKQVRETTIPIPPTKSEQTVIATVLSNTDTLIDHLEKLINKKKAIKQGTMQHLLTGKKRLTGFGGKWNIKKLGEVSKIESGINKSLSFIGKGGAIYITVLELYEGSHIPTEKAGRIEVSDDEIRRYSLHTGDIVFGKSSVKRDGIGYPNIFIGYKEPTVFSGFTFRARVNSKLANPFYIIHLLRMPNTRNWLISNSQASALTNINQRIASSIPIFIPLDVNEQTAIATILSDMDSEIEGLEKKREKYVMIKQGMMQQLLTGKIRIYAN